MKPAAFVTAVLAIVLMPALAPAQTPELGKPVFCKGTYALCIRAVCTPVPTRDAQGHYTTGNNVVCSCVVENGWSMGPGSCASRAPVKEGKFTYLISTYSNRFNNQEKSLTCNNPDTEWAWCYGAPCVVNPRTPKSATCKCPIYKSAMSTLGGKCSQKSCNLVWSAATPKADKAANDIFHAYMVAYNKKNHTHYPVNKPAKACLRGAN